METILSPHSFCPLLKTRPFPLLLHPKSIKPICCKCNLSKQSPKIQSLEKPTSSSWISNVQHGLAALAISLALNFSLPVLTGAASASEFDVLNDGPPKESYVIDDAGVLSRVTRSDLKRLLTDLESRKGFHINVVTVRKLTVSDQVLMVLSFHAHIFFVFPLYVIFNV